MQLFPAGLQGAVKGEDAVAGGDECSTGHDSANQLPNISAMAKENIKHKGSENLIPFDKRSEEEQREMRVKGGKASGRKRREKRAFKELLEIAFSTTITNKQTGEQATRKEVSAIRLVEKCVNGDLKAMKLAAELMGEKVQKMEIQGKDGKDLFSKLSEDELRSQIEELDRKLS